MQDVRGKLQVTRGKRQETRDKREERRDKQAGGYGIKENFQGEGNTQEGDRGRHVGCGLDGLSRPTSQFSIALFVLTHVPVFKGHLFPLSFFL